MKNITGAIAFHNLSEENLLSASNLFQSSGYDDVGLIAPSIAISTNEHTTDSFGEITLMLSQETIDPKKVAVFNADVYTGRQSRAINEVDHKALMKAMDLVQSSLDDADDDMVYSARIKNRLENDGVRGLLHLTTTSPGMLLAFARSEGRNPRIPRKEVSLSILISSQKEIRKWFKENNYRNLHDGDPKLDELTKLVEAGIDRLSTDLANGVGRSRSGENKKTSLDKKDFYDRYTEIYMTEIDGKKQVTDNTIRKMANDCQNLSKKIKPVDQHKLTDSLSVFANKNKAKLNNWLESTFSPALRSEYFYATKANGDRIKRKYTPENILKEMTKNGIRDAEGFCYGPGNLRALTAKQFKNTSEIGEGLHKIVSEEEFDKVKDFSNKLFGELSDRMLPFYRFDSATTMGYSEDLIDSLKGYVKGSRTVLNECFKDLGPGEMFAINDYLTKLKNMETSYFEAKFERIVYLNEFAAAIVPKTIGKEALATLKESGLRIKTYDPLIEGDRNRVINSMPNLIFCKKEIEVKKTNTKELSLAI